MTTLSLWVRRHLLAAFFITTIAIPVLLPSCRKGDHHHHDDDRKNPASAYTSEVLDKWMTMQIRLLRNATGVPNHGFARHVAYTGAAAIESLAPGLQASERSWLRWNGLTGLPTIKAGQKYYYPASVNAAMAAMNRSFFPAASAADKAAIDSLESQLNSEFASKRDAEVLSVSGKYGEDVAKAIFEWSETDDYKKAGDPYTPPVGPGLWVATPPAFAAASTPYFRNNRTIISGSTVGTEAVAPPPYSIEPNSAFYKMVQEVYDASQTLTDDQKAMATFWRDVPGVTSPGHWLSIVQQVIRKKNAKLDMAAMAYALAGAAVNDALIATFKVKYQYNLVRPITYIHTVMGHKNWASHLTTPAHPEYLSAHASLSAAAAAVLERLFGNLGTFTDRTYDYLGFTPRTYNSFMSIAEEAGISRLYAGIHYQPSITAGITQGKKVVENMFSQIMMK